MAPTVCRSGPPIHYINLTDQAVQSKFPFIDRRDKTGNFAPYSTAWNVEGERVINRMLTVRLKFLQSWEDGMITLQPEIVDTRHAMVLGSGGSAETRQMEFTSRIGANANRQFYFSYVRQYAYGDVSSASEYLGNFPYPVVRSVLAVGAAQRDSQSLSAVGDVFAAEEIHGQPAS